MTTKSKKSAKSAPAKKIDNSGEVMSWTGPARVTAENVITTGKVAGAERWFILKQIISHKQASASTVTVVATRREFRYRGMESLAKPVKAAKATPAPEAPTAQ